MPFSLGQAQIRLSNTTQRTSEGAAKKYAAPYWRAHETSLGKRPAKQDQKGHGRCPFLAPNPQRPLLFTRTTSLFILRQSVMWHACCAPRPDAVLPAFYYNLLFASWLVYSRPPTIKRGADPGTRRYGICKLECGAAPSRRAHEITLRTNPTSTGCWQALESDSPGHPTCRCPLLFTRTACYFFYCFFCCEGPRICCSSSPPAISRSYATTHS